MSFSGNSIPLSLNLVLCNYNVNYRVKKKVIRPRFCIFNNRDLYLINFYLNYIFYNLLICYKNFIILNLPLNVPQYIISILINGLLFPLNLK